MKIISRYNQHPPSEQDWANNNNRTIGNVPLYAPEEVLQVLRSENVHVVTSKAINDVSNLGFDENDVAVLLRQALNQGHFLGAEWTRISPKACAACDAYRLRRSEEINDRIHDIEYYIKFAMNSQGALVLIVSCHLSQ